MKLSDYVISTLSNYTKHVFLIPGGGCIHLVDSLGKSDITSIPTLAKRWLDQGSSVRKASLIPIT